tara:strand:- start:150 stop:467 length:318 start_codon:yes stop_codon:yes gene_type:complete
MKIIRKQEICEDVPRHWAAQYSGPAVRDELKDITAVLQALPKRELTPMKINAIIGNSTWTDLNCDECGEDSERVVSLGCGDFNGGREALICASCLEKALGLLRTP